MRLHVYTVHIDPAESAPYEKAEFIEEGFNWRAFVFTGFYTLYKRLWLATFGIVAFNLLTIACYQQGWLHKPSLTVIGIAFQILVGYHVNDWIRAKLAKRGFIVTDLVSGESILRAELRFYDRFAATHSLSPVHI